jgi:transcription-repair coupling factor (superfamily II helicase)
MPEIKVGKAHGGMSSGALDEVMNQFYDGDFEVLVCTTIVESGLDIPAANTIIMDRAHLFGLAQLYQIRGRVGRSNVQSYAYLTYPNDTLLSTVARKRLEIICSYDKLGAGFSIANHDMDIRGYGNLVGEEQSGCIKEVGLELYQSMLESAIADLQGAISYSEGVVQDSVTEAPSPILNLGVSIQIPEDYVDDTDTRLSLYRRVAGASNSQDVDDLELEIIDRFGPLPDGVKHLLKVIKLKILAKKAGISKLDVTEKGIVITFYQGAPQNVTKVLDFIASNSLVAKLKEDNKIFIKSLGEKDADQVIRTIEQIIRQISE